MPSVMVMVAVICRHTATYELVRTVLPSSQPAALHDSSSPAHCTATGRSRRRSLASGTPQSSLVALIPFQNCFYSLLVSVHYIINMSSKWQQQPNRHYCALCNVWMANDRISIATHENGRKHKEAVEKDLQSRRADKLEEERRRKDMEDSLRAIEAAAGKKLEEDLGGGAFAGYSYSHAGGVAAVAAGATGSYPPSNAAQVLAQPTAGPGSIQSKQQPDASAKKEMSSWNERKNKRKADATDRRGGEGANDGDDANGGAAAAAKRRKVRKLAADEGHYTLGENDDKRTYLEGKVYSAILEEEMPVQIWIGDDDAPTSSMELEMKRDDRQHL